FDEKRGYIEFAEAMQDAGAAFISVHGRTRSQFYSGKADWDAIKEIKAALTIPVVGNGDVFSAEDAIRMMDYTGCDAVMIARGALGNPWIFKEANELQKTGTYIAPETEEIKSLMAKHAQMLVSAKGEYSGIRQMRAHAGFYIKGIKGAAKIRARLNQSESLDELLSIIKEI
ncbi:MAG: tRNA-dihydrouridine synthase, partial [Firmicutes bacterium]|nr:tRNA-dihydrouridine synthase [Bacillota bacterium]